MISNSIYLTRDTDNKTAKWFLKNHLAFCVFNMMAWEAADTPFHFFRLKKPKEYFDKKNCTRKLLNKTVQKLENDLIIQKVQEECNDKNMYVFLRNDFCSFEDWEAEKLEGRREEV